METKGSFQLEIIINYFFPLISVMLCYVMLCYVMLCYVMLCYVMLCYVMLCYGSTVTINMFTYVEYLYCSML